MQTLTNKSNTKIILGAILLLLIIGFNVFAAPILVLTIFNILLKMAGLATIPYTFGSWFCSFVLLLIIRSPLSWKKTEE